MLLDPAPIGLAVAGDASAAPAGERTLALSPAAIAAAETVALASSVAPLLRVIRHGQAEEVARAEALQADAERLAAATVRHLLQGAPDAAALEAEAARVAGAEAALTNEAGEQVRAVVGGPRGLLLAASRPYLRRAALEELGTAATLVLDEAKNPVLAVTPTPPERLRVLLANEVVTRALEWAMADPVAAVDMSAAEWYFRAWSDPRIRGDGVEAARNVREEEWLALERRSVAFGRPVLAEMEEHGATAAWAERTRLAAAALARSETGIYRVMENLDGDSVVEKTASGERFTVRSRRLALEPGWTLVGRLIPLDDGAYVASAGTAVVPARRRTARVDVDLVKKLPRVLAMEVHLSLLIFGDHRRQRVLPADGPSEAQARLLHAYEVLNDPQESPSSGIVAVSPDGSRHSATPKLDHVIVEWLQAVMEMAKKGARLDRSTRKKAKKRGRR